MRGRINGHLGAHHIQGVRHKLAGSIAKTTTNQKNNNETKQHQKVNSNRAEVIGTAWGACRSGVEGARALPVITSITGPRETHDYRVCNPCVPGTI